MDESLGQDARLPDWEESGVGTTVHHCFRRKHFSPNSGYILNKAQPLIGPIKPPVVGQTKLTFLCKQESFMLAEHRDLHHVVACP
jgi:hypothetical protein